MSTWDLDDDDLKPDPKTISGLRHLVDEQRDSAVAIATGTAISSQKAAYRRRRAAIRDGLRKFGLMDPFWPDLDSVWAWAKRWNTYAERRSAIAERITPLEDQLDDLERSGKVDDWGGSPDDWAQLELRLAGLRDEMDHATGLDQFQDVGRRGREVLIDAVDLMFSEDMVPEEKDGPKGGDAKARFDLIVSAYAVGTSHAELRKLMRAAWDLTQKVTHGDITRVDAYAAAQSTVLIVRTLAEMHQGGRQA